MGFRQSLGKAAVAPGTEGRGGEALAIPQQFSRKARGFLAEPTAVLPSHPYRSPSRGVVRCGRALSPSFDQDSRRNPRAGRGRAWAGGGWGWARLERRFRVGAWAGQVRTLGEVPDGAPLL